MKKIKEKIIVVLFVLFSIPVHAVTEQVPINRTITSINAYDNLVFINFEPAFDFNQGCTHPDGSSRVTIKTNTDLGRNIYAAALSAATSKLEVGFGVDGCLSDRPKAYRIDVRY